MSIETSIMKMQHYTAKQIFITIFL